MDGWTVQLVEQRLGIPGFLDGLRAQLKTGTFRPLPVRERLIPKPGGSGKLSKRCRRRAKGLPSWRIVRYADLCRARHERMTWS